ncbi:MAG: hypothetical protein LBS56_00325 [Propionibacteriaceae bacterium]|jgi:uroporphyrinogen decarboxylase|nr:hypothetical protein [Propionibacteriaceae bacterium]
MTLSHRERFHASLQAQADRPAVTAWHHFVDREWDPFQFVDATAAFARRWDWDWVKVNTRATLFSEIWGTQFDRHDYAGQSVPALVAPGLTLERLAEVAANPHSPIIQEQASITRVLRARLPEVPLLPTVFSPLTTLYFALGLPSAASFQVYGHQVGFGPERVWDFDPAAVAHALEAIAETLATLVAALRDAGAEGIFYAHTAVANAHLSKDKATFDRLSTPYDKTVLRAAEGSAVVLHTCGPDAHVDWFEDWPVQALSWDPTLPGNPALADVSARAPVGGVDRNLFDGRHPLEITAQARQAITDFQGRPFLLAPTCSLDINYLVEADFAALAEAVA